ncbi:protein FAR1-RELATED SEQUENCE 5-like [Ipomoea triloba]|uniref:protein FAR1-RELATED SEQUENCE 5-like n=1 Tax=Ipomoea triloba TaxID=35885 RepID=UPI00125D4317|nr:protein FAR1-RELATED SEQUENCE 5-like [Ipomoea triloba]
MKTPLAIERHAANVYTINIFYEVQTKIVAACFNCRVVTISKDGDYVCYEVQCSTGRVFNVCHNPRYNTNSCACKMFNRIGLLYRHILYVLKEYQQEVILSGYVMKRWGKCASMGSIQLQQTTAQQNTIPGGTLQHQVWMDFNACMGMARGDDQRLLQISHAMSEVKQKIQTDGRTVAAKLGNAAIIQTMCGTPSSLPVTIRPPVVAKNKGSGKRLKGAREKAITSKKKGRKCHTCDLALGHDTRNCPLLDPVLQ